MSKGSVIDADDVPADFECAICQDVLNRPVVLPCKHLFCSECLAASLKLKHMCPLCRADLPAGYSPSRAVDVIKQMEGIKVRCSNKGCSAVVTLPNLRSHQESCRYANASAEPIHVFHAPEGHHPPPEAKNRSTFTCPYCGEKNLPLKDLLEHVNTKHARMPASKRQVICPVCVSMPWGDPHRTVADFNRHINERHKFDYAEYCDFDGSEEDLLAQALRESRQEAEAARRKNQAPAPAPAPAPASVPSHDSSHRGLFGMFRRQRPDPAPPSSFVPDDDDDDPELRRALELSLRDY